jgi:hypothetical protein
MKRINNPMEIYKLLNRSNCRECNEKTCLAFAVAVFKDKKQLGQCPHLDRNILEEYGGDIEKPNTIDEDTAQAVENLKKRISEIDLSAAASRLNATFSGDKLTFRVFGKNFNVDSKGNLSSEIHINAWLAYPLLNHILEGKGVQISGNWVPFRELPNGRSRAGIFQQRCKKPLKQVADTYTNLFKDMLEIFDGKKVEQYSGSDISIGLSPLPLIPILICYWKPEEELKSDLHIFFDETCEDNLDIDSLYTLVAGIVKMFEKIALRHGFKY